MGTTTMAPRKKRDTANKALAKAILNEYQPTNVDEMQDALKDIFGPMFEAMPQGEMDAHLGYESNDHDAKNTDNRRNGYSKKTVKSEYGNLEIEVPRDRDGSFEPQVIPKRTGNVSGIEDKVLAMYAKGMSQRDIAETIEDIYVHLVRNSLKYVPSKDYKAFTAQLKKIYGAASLKAAESEFERFKQAWSHYPGAVAIWERNWPHVAQLFNYGSAVRKIMYTTNAIESVNASLRKVTKKGIFQNETSVMKVLYLRITELEKKWNNRKAANWAMVRNQLAIDETLQPRIERYENR